MLPFWGNLKAPRVHQRVCTGAELNAGSRDLLPVALQTARVRTSPCGRLRAHVTPLIAMPWAGAVVYPDH